MIMPTLEREPITANESEKAALRKLDKELQKDHFVLKVAGTTGEFGVPESVSRILAQIVHDLTRGRAITIVPHNKELTTQEAADILNVSRPHVVKLLEQGDILFTKVGTHRRIRFGDLMVYKSQRDKRREEGLRELEQLSHEMGLYDL